MPRLFVGIDIPGPIADRLVLMHGGIPGARWQLQDKLHVTLRFVGSVDGRIARETLAALEQVRHDPFSLTLAGVGHFPPRGQPRSLWVGVEDDSAIAELKRKVDRALAGLPIEPDRRKFHAHVTLARLRNPKPHKVAEFLTQHSLFRSDEFDVGSFQAFSSVLSPRGSKYRIEASYPLDPSNSP